jgi:hypothetical protein
MGLSEVQVVNLHRSGQLKGEALRKELVALGISEDQAKVMVK